MTQMEQFGTNEEMLARLAGLATRFDPVPEQVLAAARGSFAWATADLEIAELVYDSIVDDAPLVGVRSGAAPRHLTFEGPALTMEMEVSPAGGRVLGQLVPAQPALVEVCHPAGSVPVEADELGCFAVEGFPPGPVSVRCHTGVGPDRTTTSTDWIAI